MRGVQSQIGGHRMGYEDLLEAAKGDPDTVDFTELRMAYAKSPGFSPHADRRAFISIAQTIDLEDPASVIEGHNRVLDACYLNIFAHMALANGYAKQKDNVRSSYHRRFAKGLLDSILASGDGRSHDTAFKVIDISEEYAVMTVTGLKPHEQGLQDHGGHWYDVLKVEHIQTGKQFKIFFNIDLSMDRTIDEMAKHDE
jgi:hypothetical protein